MHLQDTDIFIKHLPGTVLGSGVVSDQGLPGPSGSLSALSHLPMFCTCYSQTEIHFPLWKLQNLNHLTKAESHLIWWVLTNTLE